MACPANLAASGFTTSTGAGQGAGRIECGKSKERWRRRRRRRHTSQGLAGGHRVRREAEADARIRLVDGRQRRQCRRACMRIVVLAMVPFAVHVASRPWMRGCSEQLFVCVWVQAGSWPPTDKLGFAQMPVNVSTPEICAELIRAAAFHQRLATRAVEGAGQGRGREAAGETEGWVFDDDDGRRSTGWQGRVVWRRQYCCCGRAGAYKNGVLYRIQKNQHIPTLYCSPCPSLSAIAALRHLLRAMASSGFQAQRLCTPPSHVPPAHFVHFIHPSHDHDARLLLAFVCPLVRCTAQMLPVCDTQT